MLTITHNSFTYSFNYDVFDDKAADTNANGGVDILDATAIQRSLSGFEGHDAIGKPIG